MKALALALLAAACDPGWAYHIPDRAPVQEASSGLPRYTFSLVGGQVEYRLRCLFFVAGVDVWSELENRGTTPLAFHVRHIELLDAAGEEIPLRDAFEDGAVKTGFYSEPNRGEEFRTGLKIIAPGQTYRIAHRFGSVPAFEPGSSPWRPRINPRLRAVRFTNRGLESGGAPIPFTVTLEADFR
ncbi:MAG TPA: hypothetical protein VN914_02465 [Polyangia bacterium]|nr:hypothetical protein [Polyangia bacterium]